MVPSPEPPPVPDPAPEILELSPETAGIADGVEHPLDPRWIKVQRVSGWLVAGPILAVLLAVLVLVLWRTSLPIWIDLPLGLLWAVVAAGVAWCVHRLPEIEHRHAFYKVDEWGIEIRKGVWWRKVINVPRSRVQHTDVSQGPLERRYGLATLVIYTAGTSYAKVDLGGLDHGAALRIRDHLLAGEGGDAV